MRSIHSFGQCEATEGTGHYDPCARDDWGISPMEVRPTRAGEPGREVAVDAMTMEQDHGMATCGRCGERRPDREVQHLSPRHGYPLCDRCGEAEVHAAAARRAESEPGREVAVDA